jgi:hypothetical protein
VTAVDTCPLTAHPAPDVYADEHEPIYAALIAEQLPLADRHLQAATLITPGLTADTRHALARYIRTRAAEHCAPSQDTPATTKEAQ